VRWYSVRFTTKEDLMFSQMLYRGPSREVLHTRYAKSGRIDERAPITSSSQVLIAAPVDQVWPLIINLPAWPTITPSIRDVRIESRLEVDALVRFRLNNFPIRARLAVVQPKRELTWTGVSLWFTAIDRIVLDALSDDQTCLSIAESFAGLFAVPLMSRTRLQSQHEQWLQAFKRAAERGTSITRAFKRRTV
jgi:hypothetical protein